MANAYFSRATLQFLAELSRHNTRAWFTAHQPQYEAVIREPALALIRDFAPRLRRFSTHFVAADRKVGGSLMRIQRDVRFAADKSPYKTNIGIQFRHEAGKDVHAPGLYLHVAPSGCFVGAGIWHPDPATLARIRARIVAKPQAWRAAVEAPAFAEHFALGGDSLKRAPRGFDPEHPLVTELMRTDHIAARDLKQTDLTSPRLLDLLDDSLQATRAYVAFLCEALDLPL